jgi:LPXTG-motif cell wall-anchored protein
MPTPRKRRAGRADRQGAAAKEINLRMKTANRLLAHLHRHSLWRVACVALGILLLTSTAFAAQPLTGTFRGKVIGRYVNFTNLNNRVVTDWAGVLGLQLDRDAPGDGLGPLVPVFCIEVNVLVRGGDRYVSDGPVTALHGGCQIRYLLDRYPASTATTADEAAARQLAIWHFSDDIDLTTVQEAVVRTRAIALADEAALAVALGGCPSSQTTIPSLTIDPPTANVSTGQVVKYTVTVDPASAAQSIDIIISGSATLQNGLQQATLPLAQGVATFSVVNPIAGTSTITARLPYVLDAGTVFSPINGSRPTQRLVMGDRISLIANATVQATWAQATATPIATTPTATPSTGGSPTATPSTGSSPTATPFTADTPTITPFTADTPTTTPSTGGSPTAAPPTPGNAPPPATPTRRPSNGTQPTRTPATQSTPEGTPSNGATSPPDSGIGSTAPTPTPTGGIGAAGGPSSGGGANGNQQIRPSQLPNTGGSGSTAAGMISVAVLLIVCGVWLRTLRKRRA